MSENNNKNDKNKGKGPPSVQPSIEERIKIYSEAVKWFMDNPEALRDDFVKTFVEVVSAKLSMLKTGQAKLDAVFK